MLLLIVLISTCLSCLNSTPVSNKATNAMEGKYFQGDMRGIDYKMEDGRIFLANPDFKGTWKYGIIPYVIDSAFAKSEIDLMKSAMKTIEDQTRTKNGDCIRFIPRVNEKPYIKIVNGDGCFSYVGRQDTGWLSNSQELSLKRGACMYKGIIMHEFMHAMGFHHEHTFLNRDNFVTVNKNNIVEGKEIMFEKYDTQPATSVALPYDILSIMHFDNYAFSKSGAQTLVSKQNIKLHPISQKVSLSSIDVEKIRRFYGCN